MISIIIPTRNRAQLLGCALTSISTMDRGNIEFEIIIIDNDSNDNTEEVAKKHSLSHGNTKYFHESKHGLHNARNRGMHEASGDILSFIDDDVELFPSWLKGVKESFDKQDTALVGGNNIPMFIEPPPPWLMTIWNMSRLTKDKILSPLSLMELKGEARTINPRLIWGCNFSIRKRHLISAKGFHPDGVPNNKLKFRGDGETYISEHIENLGLLSIFNPDASVFHKVPPNRMSKAYFHQSGFRSGISDSYSQLREKKKPVKHSQLKNILNTIPILHSLKAVQALKAYQNGYNEGYLFHQNAYNTDHRIRSWVHQEHYMNEKGHL